MNWVLERGWSYCSATSMKLVTILLLVLKTSADIVLDISNCTRMPMIKLYIWAYFTLVILVIIGLDSKKKLYNSYGSYHESRASYTKHYIATNRLLNFARARFHVSYS